MVGNSKRLYEFSQLQYDILRTVTAPLTDELSFMSQVLECFKENISSYGYLFYRYQEDPLHPGEYLVGESIGFGLPKTLYGDNWSKSYYETCIYNPNKNRRLLNERKSVFSMEEIISRDDYEKSKNYLDVIKPAGIYYSFAVILKQNGKPLGHITLSRPKSDGKFNREELSRIESIADAIGNRLSDFDKISCLENIAALQDLFDRHIIGDGSGALLLNENHRVLFYNDRATELAEDLFGHEIMDRCSERGVQCLADKMSGNCVERLNSFEILDNRGRVFYCSSTPCFITGRKGLSKAYMIQIDPDKRITTVGGADGDNLTSSLTRRQMEIIHFISCGLSNREIAEKLSISEGTVKKHVENIRVNLGVSSRIGILKKLHML